MNHYASSLLIGLTTVFAWTPATILMLLALFGFYTGLLYFDEVGIVRLLALTLLGIASVIGYVGLTSVCWGLKLNSKLRLIFLVIGLVALTCAIVIGLMSDNSMLHISFKIEEMYLFICPLVFLLLHVVLDSFRVSRDRE